MIGSRLAHFEITRKLGEGGMGEVYQATDSRLGRDVALKILPAAFTADPARLARFEREARALASLSHPNVASIHDVGHAEGVHFLVMELADGETLESRLRRGACAPAEALEIAAQIAEALETAHAKGIVHRDLKPANVMLAQDGRVKLLDFGLAKALVGETEAADPSGSHSPTMTAQATAAGVILGTAAYMSPEQARGQAVDARADIWAFGLLLYEMLTGVSPFRGDTVSDTLAAVLRGDIDWSALPASTPPSLRNLLRRCLERDVQQRLHAVSDARIVLREVIEAGPEAWKVPDSGPAPWRLLAWTGAAFVAGLLLSAVFFGTGETEPAGVAAPATASLTFRSLTQLPGAEQMPAIAPDGESFAYVKDVEGQSDIFLQRVDGRNAINLTPGCEEDDTEPTFSRDGRRIAFRSECSGGGIFVMGATGESVRKVTASGYSPTWSPDGTEIAVVTEQPGMPWGRTTSSELWAVRVETGERRQVSEHDAMHPSWSPDGRRIAFWGLRWPQTERDIWTVAADGSQKATAAAVPVTNDRPLDWNPVWSGTGDALLFSSTRGGTFNLWRIAVDPATGEPAGAPVAMTVPSGWAGWLSVSGDDRRIAFVDRNARNAVFRVKVQPSGDLAGQAEPLPIGSFEVSSRATPSPDADSVLFATTGLPQHLVVVHSGGDVRQLTSGPHRNRQGAWSPDGEWIVFQTDRYDETNLALVRADGSGLRPLRSVGRSVWNPIWSHDGRHIAYTGRDGARIVTFDPEAAVEPEKLADPGDGLYFGPAAFSRDGRLLVGELNSAAGSEGLAVLSRRDGTYRRLPAGPGATAPQFFQDENRLVWTEDGRIVHHDLATGETRDLILPAQGRLLFGAFLSSDRNWLVYLEVADESDIWLAMRE